MMIPITLVDMQLLIAAVLFLLGCLSIMLGAFILIARGYSREIKTIAAHTARLGHKGIAEEATSLVSSASSLIDAINQLVKTASGVGVVLILFGLIMLIAAYWIVSRVSPVAI
jgi:hypothetical protein